MNRSLTTFAFVFGTSSMLLVDSAIKGGVILAVAACVAVLLRRDSAATRHLVWLVAIVAMLVVPVFSALLPQWQVLPVWAAIPKVSPTLEMPTSAVEFPNAFQASLPVRVGPGESDVPSTMGDRPLAAETFAQLAHMKRTDDPQTQAFEAVIAKK